jgi:hypothetical protein
MPLDAARGTLARAEEHVAGGTAAAAVLWAVVLPCSRLLVEMTVVVAAASTAKDCNRAAVVKEGVVEGVGGGEGQGARTSVPARASLNFDLPPPALIVACGTGSNKTAMPAGLDFVGKHAVLCRAGSIVPLPVLAAVANSTAPTLAADDMPPTPQLSQPPRPLLFQVKAVVLALVPACRVEEGGAVEGQPAGVH